HIDRLTHRLFGLREVHDGARFHAAGNGMTEADNFDGVRAAAQNILRRMRPELPDQAHDFAGANVESGDDRRAATRQRFRLWREPELEDDAHALSPFLAAGFFLSSSERACAAAGESRTVTRSATRRSIATTSRDVSLNSRSRSASLASAREGSTSGRRTSWPLRSRRFQRRSPTRTDARTWLRISG